MSRINSKLVNDYLVRNTLSYCTLYPTQLINYYNSSILLPISTSVCNRYNGIKLSEQYSVVSVCGDYVSNVLHHFVKQLRAQYSNIRCIYITYVGYDDNCVIHNDLVSRHVRNTIIDLFGVDNIFDYMYLNESCFDDFSPMCVKPSINEVWFIDTDSLDDYGYACLAHQIRNTPNKPFLILLSSSYYCTEKKLYDDVHIVICTQSNTTKDKSPGIDVRDVVMSQLNVNDHNSLRFYTFSSKSDYANRVPVYFDIPLILSDYYSLCSE